MKKIFVFSLFASMITFKASAQKVIATKDAASHINEKITVCDKVFSTKLISGSNITFLDLGGFHPNELVTVVIKGGDRSKFRNAPEDYYRGKNVCVTGTVIDYKGKPEIIVSDSSQIKLNPVGAPNEKKADN